MRIPFAITNSFHRELFLYGDFMIFNPVDLSGAFHIEIERIEDERGFFARSWCRQEASEQGIDIDFVQCNISRNLHKGILRGMHYQYPNWEAKLVRVTQGAIQDVIVDLRPDSETYKQHYSVELSAQRCNMLLIPKGFAHGFVSLEADTEIFYQMSEYYVAGQDRGFRYDDPQIGIVWPTGEKHLSDRDYNLPGFEA